MDNRPENTVSAALVALLYGIVAGLIVAVIAYLLEVPAGRWPVIVGALVAVVVFLQRSRLIR